MNSKELITALELVSNEKNIPLESVYGALEEAMASATRRTKFSGEDNIEIRAEFDTKNGTFRIFKQNLKNPNQLDEEGNILSIKDAKSEDIEEVQLPNMEFGRIAAQAAKQVIFQKVREAEREQLAKRYEERIGQLIIGQVRQLGREEIIITLDSDVEAALPRHQLLPRDRFRGGDKVKAMLYEIDGKRRGHQLLLSRIHPQTVAALFTRNVPEIAEHVVVIKGVAREAGHRSKVAVKTKDRRVDPIGACIGMRGMRVQEISDELGGERIDVIEWKEQPGEYAIEALSIDRKDIVSVLVDEEKRVIDIATNEKVLAQAIGRNGQNVRLASELLGWKINIMTGDEAESKHQKEHSMLAQKFIESLGVEKEVADILVVEGFANLEEIAYANVDEMLEIEGFNNELIEDLRSRARDALLSEALLGDGDKTPQKDLLELEGMNEDIAAKLAANKIVKLEDLANLATYELLEIIDLEEQFANKLILDARASCFGSSGE